MIECKTLTNIERDVIALKYFVFAWKVFTNLTSRKTTKKKTHQKFNIFHVLTH